MTTIEDDERPDDTDELLEKQEHKGYGDDEGEPGSHRWARWFRPVS